MIKAVIYDLDDTMVDSIGLHIEANNADEVIDSLKDLTKEILR